MNASLVYETLKNAAQKWPNSPAIFDEYGMLTFEQLYTKQKS